MGLVIVIFVPSKKNTRQAFGKADFVGEEVLGERNAGSPEGEDWWVCLGEGGVG